MIAGCGSQLRTAGMAGVPIGLDMGTVMQIGTARRVDLDLLADVLPAVEAAILNGRDGDVSEEDEHG